MLGYDGVCWGMMECAVVCCDALVCWGMMGCVVVSCVTWYARAWPDFFTVGLFAVGFFGVWDSRVMLQLRGFMLY